jgi:hypothetical protein
MEFAEEDGRVGLLESVACALLRPNSPSLAWVGAKCTFDPASPSSAAARDAEAIEGSQSDVPLSAVGANCQNLKGKEKNEKERVILFITGLMK